MIITCEKCNSSFNLKDSLVKPAGSKVRCSKCKHIFLAYPPEKAPEQEQDMIKPEIQNKSSAVPDLDIPVPAFKSGEAEMDLKKAPTKKPSEEDLELDLDFDDDAAEPEPGMEEKTAADSQNDLDFSDLGKMFDDEDKITGSQDTGEEPELALALEGEDQSSEDELDFSGIGEMIDEEVEAGERKNHDDDMDLDLSLADEDLSPASGDQDEDLDFSDLEKILDEDGFEADAPAKDDLELDLDLELASEEEKEEGMVLEMEKPNDEDEDMDFSDIEEMLESEEDSVSEEVPELVMEPKEEDPPKDSEDGDFELSFEEDPPEKLQADEPETPVSDEEIEVNVDTDEEPETHISTGENIALNESAEEETADEDDEEPEESEHTPLKEKKKTSPALIILLILVLIGGGGYAAMTMLGIDIMKIPAMLKGGSTEPGIKDPGYLKITTHDVRSKFIDNVKGGRLFVITGSVTNEYPTSRSFISLMGKLFAKEKVLAKTENVFAGNFLSDIDLTQMDLETIYLRLRNENGDNDINKGVKTQGNIPFMIVFSDLPEDLAEFTIEVTGSASE